MSDTCSIDGNCFSAANARDEEIRLTEILNKLRYGGKMTIASCGTGDEKTISEMTDEELMKERDFWNNQLKPDFYTSSHTYDISATIVKEIEMELNRREHEGPPWIVD